MFERALHRAKPLAAWLLSMVLVAGLLPAGSATEVAYAQGEGDGSAAAQAPDESGSADAAAAQQAASPDASDYAGQSDAGMEHADGDGAATGTGQEASDAVEPAEAGLEQAQPADQDQAQVQAETEDALDPTALADGTYTVNVALVKSDDFSSPSMAASAFDGTATLTVSDGAYVASLDLGSVVVSSVTGYVKQLAYYETYTVEANKLTTSGSYKVVYSTSEDGPGRANVPIVDTAKASGVGYAALRLWSAAMGSTSQTAALKIDWTSLAKTSEEVDSSSFDTDVSGEVLPESEDTSNGSGSDSDTPAASKKFGGVFEKGHVYSVPITFKKEGSSETSMAAQYFGSSATVRMADDNTFDVRFSTNRPDYITSMTYKGANVAVKSETSSSREYSINMPATTSDTVAPLTMTVKPMVELGSGAVTTDMHLAFSQAKDMGGDTGQSASSTPKTGDPLGTLPAGLGVLACASGLSAAVSRRKMKEN